MRLLLGLVGASLLVTVLVELLWTTFLEGAGPLTKRLCNLTGGILLAVHHRCHTRRAITKSGLTAVMATLTLWIVLLWAGWAMIFCAGARALVFAADGAPADVAARIYFTGYTISTVGLGDYRPEGRGWQFLTALCGGSGFLLFGLAIAYIVPVVSTETQKRQLAVCISALGANPADIIVRAWNGADTTALGPHLVSLTAMLALLGESHLTYPVLHYFHSSRRSSATAPNVAALDEALTILECGLQRGCSLDLPSLGAAREAITEFLRTLKPALIEPADKEPPSPSLAPLRDMGVPVVDDETFRAAVAGMASRRRLLLALVRNEGWTWDEVWPGSSAAAAPPPPAASSTGAALPAGANARGFSTRYT